MTTEFETLAAASRALEKGEVSAIDLTKAKLAICDQAEPVLRNFITLDPKSALDMAAAADEQRRGGDEVSPLAGIPIAFKDIIDVGGMRCTGHSRLYADRVAKTDAFTVSLLRNAGAVFLGKLATNEFAIGLHDDETALAPQPRNPWNAAHSTGGSSSGSGSAVAAGQVFAALGTDTGGSIRVPAAFNGVCGLKPSEGLVSRSGTMALSESMDNVGPLARTVEDVALLLDVIAVVDPHETVQLRRPVASYASESARCPDGLKFMRLRYFDRVLGDEQIRAIDAAEKALTSIGAEAVEVEFPSLEELDAVGAIMATCESYSYHRERLAAHSGLYGRDTRLKLHLGALISGDDYLLAARQRAVLRQRFALAMTQADLVLMPPSRGAAPVYAPPASPSFAQWTNVGFNPAANVLGVPSLTMPAGTESGLPVAVQLIGRHNDDALVLAAGRAVEAELRATGAWAPRWPTF
ncbi:amidase [Bradyrhizobium sp. Ce-3]|uniref:amidase n=1 Tax=Bradyrhizobium sp. Ce-3 TaxID=2913970 RepID=UPI001FC8373D|nr:amidase [Bradyrhizobium sp. Ce-3]GKQ55120.1 amidase [Bradyrhizobium sp. Ce-3]